MSKIIYNAGIGRPQKKIDVPALPTNGDILRAMFPGIEVEYRDDVVDVYGMSSFSVTFKADWFDAPYEDEDGNIRQAVID
jgi:hypothetical protein